MGRDFSTTFRSWQVDGPSLQPSRVTAGSLRDAGGDPAARFLVRSRQSQLGPQRRILSVVRHFLPTMIVPASLLQE